MSLPGFRRLSWGVAGYTLLVILWGYFLRISESGDGCGTDWPLCNGAVLPGTMAFPTLVELFHRITSGLVLLAVIGLAVAAVRTFPRGHALRAGALAALILTVTESLFGAVLVVFGWVAGDISLGRMLIRPVHVTNTFLLMAALVLTAWWATRGVSRIPRPFSGSEAGRVGPLVLPVLGVLALAWTGSWTGLAVTAFPAETLRDGLGQYVDPEHMLIYLRMSHPILAILVIGVLVRFSMRTRSIAGSLGDPAAGRLAVALAALALTQLLAGPMTIVLGNPVEMRLFHLLLADLLWAALVALISARFEMATGPAGVGGADPGPGSLRQGMGARSPVSP